MTTLPPDLLGALRLRRWALSSWGPELPAPPVESDGSWRLFLAREACAGRLTQRMRRVEIPPLLARAAERDAQLILLLRAELSDLLDVARKSGVAPVVLKGGSVLHDPRRAVAAKDLDLLLGHDDARRLISALDAGGWRSVGGGMHHHFSERVREGRPPVEVHTADAAAVTGIDAAAERRALPHPVHRGARLLAPADQARHLAIHQGIQHTSHRGRLRDLFLLADLLEHPDLAPALRPSEWASSPGNHRVIEGVMGMAAELAAGRRVEDRFELIAALWYGMDADAQGGSGGRWRYATAIWTFDLAADDGSFGERWARSWGDRLEDGGWTGPLQRLERAVPWLLGPLRSVARALWLPLVLARSWVRARSERRRAVAALAAIDQGP